MPPTVTNRTTAKTAVKKTNKAFGKSFTLSVIMRTQGKRPEALADAVLCLQAQTDQNFELILVAHNATKADIKSLKSFVDSQIPELQARIHFTSLSGVTRSVPLNAGIALATGTHIAVFDDDDLLFAHWVEEFHKAALENPGKLLRAQVFNQDVAPEEWSQGRAGLRTLSWPSKFYPQEFSMVDHILVNHTPFMSVAFPRELFSELNQQFNEQLLVVEDWDMIVRGALLCGVVDIPEVTSIYRQWQRADNSQSVHALEEWKSSEALVTANLDSANLILPPGSASRIQELLVKEEKLSNQSEAVLSIAFYVRKQGKRAVRVIRKARSLARKILK